jgi:nicotinamide-nucleotide amidase
VQAEILCVGSELLLGQIIDTNAAYIARQLARAGLDLRFKQTVGDNLDRIAQAVAEAARRSDVLVITGGLGPTTDDLTREAIALALGVPLVHVPRLEDELRAFFASRSYTPGESLMRQAYLPEGSDDIPNSCGTAPGVHARTPEGKQIFATPGVPREMKAMLDDHIVPRLLESMEGERSIIVSRVLRAFGVGREQPRRSHRGHSDHGPEPNCCALDLSEHRSAPAPHGEGARRSWGSGASGWHGGARARR